MLKDLLFWAGRCSEEGKERSPDTLTQVSWLTVDGRAPRECPLTLPTSRVKANMFLFRNTCNTICLQITELLITPSPPLPVPDSQNRPTNDVAFCWWLVSAEKSFMCCVQITGGARCLCLCLPRFFCRWSDVTLARGSSFAFARGQRLHCNGLVYGQLIRLVVMVLHEILC